MNLNRFFWFWINMFNNSYLNKYYYSKTTEKCMKRVELTFFEAQSNVCVSFVYPPPSLRHMYVEKIAFRSSSNLYGLLLRKNISLQWKMDSIGRAVPMILHLWCDIVVTIHFYIEKLLWSDFKSICLKMRTRRGGSFNGNSKWSSWIFLDETRNLRILISPSTYVNVYIHAYTNLSMNTTLMPQKVAMKH